MSLEKATDYFNKQPKQFTPRSDTGGVRVRYLRVNPTTSAVITVLSDDFVPTNAGGSDLAGNPVKYPGMQILVRDETDGKEKVWNVPRVVGKTLVDEMGKLKLKTPRDFTLKVHREDQYNYKAEVLKTPNGTPTKTQALDLNDALLEKATDVLRPLNGTFTQKDSVGLFLKVRMELASPHVGEEIFARLLEQKKVSIENNRLRVA